MLSHLLNPLDYAIIKGVKSLAAPLFFTMEGVPVGAIIILGFGGVAIANILEYKSKNDPDFKTNMGKLLNKPLAKVILIGGSLIASALIFAL